MKKHSNNYRILFYLGMLSAVAVLLIRFSDFRNAAAQNLPQVVDEGGSGEFYLPQTDELTDVQRAEIQEKIARNVERLRLEGKLPQREGIIPPPKVLLDSPLAKAPGVEDFNVDAVFNYVDQNPLFPNQVSDWNCGVRTYDRTDGYNHRGTDFGIYPFRWKKVENNEVYVVAAAPGTIVLKADGNYDRNCTVGQTFQWNAVYVMHDDNSVAWYGHLKNGSLTAKEVGGRVERGEYLGVVASSGSSNVPHVHLELYDAENRLNDPFEGACNTMNKFSWWNKQEPYRNSRVNALMTGSAPPVFPACPNPEITNEKRVFKRGEALVPSTYLRDIQVGQTIDFSILRPDGSAFRNWSFTSADTLNLSYRFANWLLPENAPLGIWNYKVEFNGQTYERTFKVSGAPFDFDGDGRADLSVFRSSDTVWYLRQSSAGFGAVQFGLPDDKLAPADYDGDGRTDIAVFRDGTWYLLQSSQGFAQIQFGQTSDIPVPADYTGDGRAELAVYRAGAWWMLNQANGESSVTNFGLSNDKPIVGDYDGDGLADQAVYRNGEWHLNRSALGYTVVNFGLPNDVLVPADYDGDGRADAAVFRDGIWYLRQSIEGVAQFQWGLSTDIPAPADYDGDGKADAAVYRNGAWYLLQSANGFSIQQFGLAGDKPVPAVFNR